MKISIQQIYMEMLREGGWESDLPLNLEREITQLEVVDHMDRVTDPMRLYLLFSERELRITDGYHIRPTGEMSAFSVINRVNDIMSRLIRVQEHMMDIALQDQDYDELINYAEEKLGLALLLVDKNLHYLAETPTYRRLNYSWMGDLEDITIEWINVLEQDEAFMNAIHHQGAFRYSLAERQNPQISYCYNVRLDGEYVARLLMQNSVQREFHGGMEWVRYLGGLIERIFHGNSDRMSQTSEALRFHEIIQSLAEERPVDPEEVRQVLNRAGWTSDHRYQVYLFRPQLEENETVNHRYYQAVLRKMMGECRVFESRDHICCVRNITGTDPIYRDVRQELSVFLRENLFYVGISNRFSDILQLRYYYREAYDALATGLSTHGTSWSYYYGDLILENILRQAEERLPEMELEHPALRTLRKYDAAEGTELVKTAFEYMRQQYNVTHTANALFIHRTTLLFRLERIRVLTGLDWNSMEDRVLLGLNMLGRRE